MTEEQNQPQDENTCEAVPLDYASRQVPGEPSAPQPPGVVLRWARRMAVVSAITLVGTFWGEDLLFFVSPVAGAFFAVIAVVSCLIAAGRNTSRQLAATDQIKPTRIWMSFVVCLLVLLGQGLLVSKNLVLLLAVARSEVAFVNLRGIGQAIYIYQKQRGTFPPALDDLKATNSVTATQFLSANDPGLPGWSASKPFYSSFEYHPGTGPSLDNYDIMVAFEKKPWTPKKLRLFPTYGRCVLFGDGHVLAIDEAEFHARLEKDKACRLMLGWPVFPLDDDGKAH